MLWFGISATVGVPNGLSAGGLWPCGRVAVPAYVPYKASALERVMSPSYMGVDR